MPTEAAPPPPSVPAAPRDLRAKAHGYAWLAVTLTVLLLLAQSLTGWPIRVRQALPPFAAGVPVKMRLPAKAAANAWHEGASRVWKDGRLLPLYRSPALLQESGRDGFSVSEKWVFVQRIDARENSPSRWVLDAPWALGPMPLVSLLALVTVWAAFLWRAENPVLVRLQVWLAAPSATSVLAAFGLALFITAILVRALGFSYPAWLNDTGSHYPAVFKVATGGSPAVTPDRPFGLPLVMGHLLRGWADLRVVVIAQMAATLLAASATGLCVWWSAARLFRSPVALLSGRALGLFAFAAIALSESMLQREWTLLAEAWVAFYLGAQLLLAWLLTARPRRLAPALGVYALLCLAGLLAFFTRPNWGLALALLPLPWLFATLRNAPPWKPRLAWLASGAAVVLAMAALTFGYQRACSQTHGGAALEERARALICWHVPLVRPEIDRRLAATPAAPEAPLLREVAQVMDAERERAKTDGPGAYPSLGYDADHLYFFSLLHAPLFSRLPSAERVSFCSDLFWSAFRRHPGLYLAKVFGQFPRFFARPYDLPKISIPHVQADLAQSIRAANGEWAIPQPILQNYLVTLATAEAGMQRPWPSPARLSMSLREVLIFDLLNATFAWLVGLSLLICAMAALVPRWRARVEWKAAAPAWTVALWALGSILLSALTAALVQGLDVQRYLELFMPLTLFCHVIWPLLALSCLGSWRDPAP